MPSNALSRKKFGPKTPAVCHPPPPPPPWPPINFQKYTWRQWLHIEFTRATIRFDLAEMITMKHYLSNEWHSRTAGYPTTPYAVTKFSINFNPLRFYVVIWYYPDDPRYPEQIFWTDKRFYNAKRWDTGELYKQWAWPRAKAWTRIQQKPP